MLLLLTIGLAMVALAWIASQMLARLWGNLMDFAERRFDACDECPHKIANGDCPQLPALKVPADFHSTATSTEAQRDVGR